MGKVFISDFQTGDSVEGVFALSGRTTARKKDGSPFLRLVLADRTGSINAVVWDDVEQAEQVTASNPFVYVKGDVSQYRDAHQLTVKAIAARDTESVDPADFLPVTAQDVNAMFRRILAITREMQSGHLKALMEQFWTDDAFVEEKFKRSPAAKMMHHAYLGGLLEHTLAVAELALVVADRYTDKLDRDMLVAGAILHDIGKAREFVYDYRIDYSDEGRLLGHIAIGMMMVNEKLALLPEFPPDKGLLIKHMIASHHGSRDLGSPEPPKTLEALVLNHIDEMDSKVTGIGDFMAGHDAGQPWTGFHRPMERFFYIGGGKADTDVHHT
ncbi:MAG: HD domain-containing protein [Thermodesulfobacteriota bacterium]|nr:HD domain-containing protein [Thermodesulfobacteriota bacterium]